jgi:hypothetical protein
MTITEFEQGKTRIMAEARDALKRMGIDYHCVMFDIHGTQPVPDGATMTVTAEGNCVSSWFPADELRDSRDQIARPEVKHKIALLVARVREAAA